MSSNDKMDMDGIRNDHVPYEPAASHLHVYADDRLQLTSFKEPILLHADSPHERLYVAALDGTGNDVIHDPEHATNVGLIYKQLASGDNSKVTVGYVAGPGTQQHEPLAHAIDGMRGYTADVRVEEMYKQFIDQARQWKKEDPDAQIRVAGTGFSRGADEVALFARMVEERGIQDSAGAKYVYDSHGQIKHVEYTKPPLVSAHEVAQAVALFDPVGTGHEMHEDRRLPPSVISGIQLTALDEHRGLFKSDRVIDPGIAPDGRFAGVYVPGAHSDVGGGYNRDGLSMRSGNIAIDYLNGLSDQPFLNKNPEPDDSRLNVIHHSQSSMLLYRVAPKIDRIEPGGYNELEVSKRESKHLADPYNAEPRNETLGHQFEWQTMPNGALPIAIGLQKDAPAISRSSSTEDMFNALCMAAANKDDAASRGIAQVYGQSDAGQTFLGMGQVMNQHVELQQQQVALQVQLQATAQSQSQNQGFCR
jgi:hypothetical protein